MRRNMRIVAGSTNHSFQSQTKRPARSLNGANAPAPSPLFGMRQRPLPSAENTAPKDVSPLRDIERLLDEALDCFQPAASRNQPVERSLDVGIVGQSVVHDLALLTARLNQPQQETVHRVRPRKVEVATHLAQWMQRILERENIQLAVVARQGGRQHRQHDVTGMLHSGIVWRNSADGCWKIYNLVDYRAKGKPQCQILWTDPVDFFYQQGGYEPDALLLVPPKAIQQRMATLLKNGGSQRLAFTRQYNLLSPPHGPDSLNCNKWVLLNVLAAYHHSEDPAFLLQQIRQTYRAEPLALDPLTRLFAGWHPQIRGKELPWWDAPKTVTVESLARSGLFERSVFCNRRRSAL